MCAEPTRPLGGDLLPSHFVSGELRHRFAGRLGEDTAAAAGVAFARWWRRCQATVGPATALRTLVETSALPLFSLLGLRVSSPRIERGRQRATATLSTRRGIEVPLVVTRWCDDLDRCWRDAVREGLASGAAWTFCWNARELRIVDARRPWSRRHVWFDLAACAADDAAFAVLWAVCRGAAFEPAAAPRADRTVTATLLDEIAMAAAREAQAVCAGLERGVTDAVVLLADAFVGRRPPDEVTTEALLDQSLTVVYRLLFLLFAEARVLVPMWHPVYRESYSVEALRDSIEHTPTAPGLWAAVQAISRLAHAGCRIGPLRVTPFNGHLFAPQRAPLAERATVRDATLRRVLEAITTASVGARRVRITFSDLGVEQLGTIYERVLDHELIVGDGALPLQASARSALAPPSGAPARVRFEPNRRQRKRSASFYTPRALANLIVRRTLAPLVEGASSEDILRLRVLDPAMGSGAFLVSACGYLARAYEAAVVREQSLRDHELDDGDRAGFRRSIARRCLFGVDRNPMAVQLARLSLWLATLAADVPLTFLDHHLKVGDSLVGASLADLMRQSPGRSRRRGHAADRVLPLLAAGDALDAMDATIPMRWQLADTPDDSIDQVHAKERLLAEIDAAGAPLARWRQAADLWCGAWFWPDRDRVPEGALYGELLAWILGGGGQLARAHVDPVLDRARQVATSHSFLHWPFEFPEVFDPRGPGGAGFDAVIGNPPWEMIRRDAKSNPNTISAGDRGLGAFVRDAGIYGGADEAHGNLYLLFVERAIQLLRPGGRIGAVVPWGLLADHGAAPVRRLLLDRCRLDSALAVDNRQALFPVHRSLKFVVFSATKDGPTRSLPMRQLAGEASALDACSDAGDREHPDTIHVSRDLLAMFSPESLAVPTVRSRDELRLLARLWSVAPALADAAGWDVRFGRELNASDDRALFQPEPPGLPVLEGKHVEPFRLRPRDGVRFIREADARAKLPREPFRAPRVGYRDVASATNQRTLIAAIVPAGAVTTHTLFCAQRSLDDSHSFALCALLNSFVANWMVRRWVSTHVTATLVGRLPVPSPTSLGARLETLAQLARRLAIAPPPALQIEARLQAVAARAWKLSRDDLQTVLEDFPLVDAALRAATRRAFASMEESPSFGDERHGRPC